MNELSPTLQLSLNVRTTEQARAMFAGLSAIARGDAAIELAIAMLLAWLGRKDPAELGHLTFSAFCRERVDWSASWRRALVRFVEGPLDLVKQAASEGLIPLRLAVRADVAIADQADWLAEAVVGDLEEVQQEPRILEVFERDDAKVIRDARRLARLCLGRAATPREVDDYLLKCWSDRVPASVILAAAHADPPVPPEEPPLSWSWCRSQAEPATIAEALERLETLQASLRGRTAVMARAWTRISSDGMWADGYDSAEDCANDVLGLSLRQAQRLVRLGWAVEWNPSLEAAMRDGLDPRSASLLATVLGEANVADWLALSARVGRQELRRAVRAAHNEGSRSILAAYRQAIALADRLPATSAGAMRVTVPHPEPEPRPGEPVRAPAELLPASRWWVEHVKLPPRRGFAAVKDRDGCRCQNPECGRVTLRGQAHHLVRRADGGGDDPKNGVTLCKVCHLRGVHGGRLRVVYLEVDGCPAWRWTWPDGREVLAFRSRPPLSETGAKPRIP